jgi:hypothetical protein
MTVVVRGKQRQKAVLDIILFIFQIIYTVTYVSLADHDRITLNINTESYSAVDVL